jgi:hypothetical protein
VTRAADGSPRFDFEVDGETLNLLEHRVGVSECIPLVLPAENAALFGLAPGQHFFAVDGYGVILDSLCPGSHVMRMNYQDGQGVRLEILYEIEVEAPSFLRGDPNSDDTTDVADAVFTLGYLFAKGKVPDCLDAADANDNGTIDIADAIATLGHLFAHTGPLPAPFGECGIDPTDDTLDCRSFPHCERP